MNSLVHEWIKKAEGDFQTAEREVRVRRTPNYDAVCFHAQQCAEKYLDEATKDEARAAVRAMRAVRTFVRRRLGLGDE